MRGNYKHRLVELHSIAGRARAIDAVNQKGRLCIVETDRE
jgi:hypothetical protein